MTTITLEKKTKLSKTDFVDIEELFNDYRNMCIAQGDYIDLVEIPEDQITDEMRKQASAARKLPRSAFTNI